MTTEIKVIIEQAGPLKRFLDGAGLKYRAVSERANISQDIFYALVRGDRVPRIDEAHAIVTALREMTGQPVTIEQLWPNGNDSEPEAA